MYTLCGVQYEEDYLNNLLKKEVYDTSTERAQKYGYLTDDERTLYYKYLFSMFKNEKLQDSCKSEDTISSSNLFNLFKNFIDEKNCNYEFSNVLFAKIYSQFGLKTKRVSSGIVFIGLGYKKNALEEAVEGIEGIDGHDYKSTNSVLKDTNLIALVAHGIDNDINDSLKNNTNKYNIFDYKKYSHSANYNTYCESFNNDEPIVIKLCNKGDMYECVSLYLTGKNIRIKNLLVRYSNSKWKYELNYRSMKITSVNDSLVIDLSTLPVLIPQRVYQSAIIELYCEYDDTIDTNLFIKEIYLDTEPRKYFFSTKELIFKSNIYNLSNISVDDSISITNIDNLYKHKIYAMSFYGLSTGITLNNIDINDIVAFEVLLNGHKIMILNNTELKMISTIDNEKSSIYIPFGCEINYSKIDGKTFYITSRTNNPNLYVSSDSIRYITSVRSNDYIYICYSNSESN